MKDTNGAQKKQLTMCGFRKKTTNLFGIENFN